jgi:hypothetical protein
LRRTNTRGKCDFAAANPAGVDFPVMPAENYPVRRYPIILMLLATTAIATGGLDFLHQRQHQQQTQEWIAAVHAAAAKHGRVPIDPPATPRNTPNCAICQALHFSIAAEFEKPAIQFLERSEKTAATFPPVIYIARIELPIHLRGPPAL